MKTAIILLILGYNIYLCIIPARLPSALPPARSITIPVDPYGLIRKGEPQLKEGDLVLRMNNDPMSFFIKNFNRKDQRYSHAGIVLMENGKPFIFHIINGTEIVSEKMRKDSLGAFADPRQNSAFGIFRYKLKEEELKGLKKKILQWYKKGLRFDAAFNLQTDDKMYCSEMVRKALGISTKGRIGIGATTLTAQEAIWLGRYAHLKPTKGKAMQVVAMDDLYMNEFCEKRVEYTY